MVRVVPYLLERHVELQTLGTAVERASTGHGSAVLVLGEAGIMQSRLVKEVGNAIGSSAPDQCGDCINDQSQPIFGFLNAVKGFLQRRLCRVLLSDIRMGTNQLNHIAITVCKEQLQQLEGA